MTARMRHLPYDIHNSLRRNCGCFYISGQKDSKKQQIRTRDKAAKGSDYFVLVKISVIEARMLTTITACKMRCKQLLLNLAA